MKNSRVDTTLFNDLTSAMLEGNMAKLEALWDGIRGDDLRREYMRYGQSKLLWKALEAGQHFTLDWYVPQIKALKMYEEVRASLLDPQNAVHHNVAGTIAQTMGYQAFSAHEFEGGKGHGLLSSEEWAPILRMAFQEAVGEDKLNPWLKLALLGQFKDQIGLLSYNNWETMRTVLSDGMYNDVGELTADGFDLAMGCLAAVQQSGRMKEMLCAENFAIFNSLIFDNLEIAELICDEAHKLGIDKEMFRSAPAIFIRLCCHRTPDEAEFYYQNAIRAGLTPQEVLLATADITGIKQAKPAGNGIDDYHCGLSESCSSSKTLNWYLHRAREAGIDEVALLSQNNYQVVTGAFLKDEGNVPILIRKMKEHDLPVERAVPADHLSAVSGLNNLLLYILLHDRAHPEAPVQFTHSQAQTIRRDNEAYYAKHFSMPDLLAMPDELDRPYTIDIPGDRAGAAEHAAFLFAGYKLRMLQQQVPELEPHHLLGQLATRYVKDGEPHYRVRWQALADSLMDVSPEHLIEIGDTMKEMVKYVGLYVLAAQCRQEHGNLEALNALSAEELDVELDDIRLPIVEAILAKKTLPQLRKLSSEWHRMRHHFLTADPEGGTLRDFAQEGEWHCMSEHKEIPVTQEGLTNYRLVNLTNAEELETEGDVLDHCVSSYVDECRKGFQIFSVRKNARGPEDDEVYEPKSTLGGNIVDGELIIDQHLGLSDALPTKQEKAVERWFLGQIRKGEIPINHMLGEIDMEYEHSPFENAVGISIDDLDAARTDKNFGRIASMNKSNVYPFGKELRHATIAGFTRAALSPEHAQSQDRMPGL